MKGEPYTRFEQAKNEGRLSQAHTLDTIALGLELREHDRHDCKKSEGRSAQADE